MQTEQTWRNLPAGPELDALVAERVLGWECHRIEKGPYTGTVVGWTKPEGGDGFPDKSPFSTDPSAAWLVVGAMEARGWVPCLKRNIERVEWEATFWATPENPAMPRAARIQADTAPLAICRAALAALEATQ